MCLFSPHSLFHWWCPIFLFCVAIYIITYDKTKIFLIMKLCYAHCFAPLSLSAYATHVLLVNNEFPAAQFPTMNTIWFVSFFHWQKSLSRLRIELLHSLEIHVCVLCFASFRLVSETQYPKHFSLKMEWPHLRTANAGNLECLWFFGCCVNLCTCLSPSLIAAAGSYCNICPEIFNQKSQILVHFYISIPISI